MSPSLLDRAAGARAAKLGPGKDRARGVACATRRIWPVGGRSPATSRMTATLLCLLACACASPRPRGEAPPEPPPARPGEVWLLYQANQLGEIEPCG
ncbi:MAG: hypothetical protein JXR96_09505 [Deltaproteobacteria bacterium]|nr:hypothetical protein [Deltaproteobacteria bacterium]